MSNLGPKRLSPAKPDVGAKPAKVKTPGEARPKRPVTKSASVDHEDTKVKTPRKTPAQVKAEAAARKAKAAAKSPTPTKTKEPSKETELEVKEEEQEKEEQQQQTEIGTPVRE